MCTVSNSLGGEVLAVEYNGESSYSAKSNLSHNLLSEMDQGIICWPLKFLYIWMLGLVFPEKYKTCLQQQYQ